jgi:hypothetical protein
LNLQPNIYDASWILTACKLRLMKRTSSNFNKKQLNL